MVWEEALVWPEDSVEALAEDSVEDSVEASVDGGRRLMPVSMGRSLPTGDMVTPTTPHIAHGAGISFSLRALRLEAVYRDG